MLALLTTHTLFLKALPSLDSETALEPLLLPSGHICHLLYSLCSLPLETKCRHFTKTHSSLILKKLTSFHSSNYLLYIYVRLSNFYRSSPHFILEFQTQISNHLLEICTCWPTLHLLKIESKRIPRKPTFSFPLSTLPLPHEKKIPEVIIST